MLVTAQGGVSEYLAAIERLAPLVEHQRRHFDEQRRIPDEVFEALADAGLFRLYLPKAVGGPELSPFDFMTIVEAASALDGSIGWLVGNGGGMSRIGGYLPEKVTRDWFADQHAFIVSATGAIGTAEPTEGGYRVSGRWPFGSGAHHATRFMGLAGVKTAEGRDEPPICCYFVKSDVQLHDTWFVSGLRGTGSCDFEVRDTFVPIDYTHPLIDFKPTQPALLYRLPGLSAFAWTVSVVPLGIARGAIDAFIDLAGKKARQGSSVLMRDRELVQGMLGRADTTLRAARAYLVDAMAELMVATDVGGHRLLLARALFRAACSNAAETAIRIVDAIAAEAGTAAIFETSTLERSVRDVHAAAKHVAMNANNYTVAGRLMLGLEPGTTRI
ncbi:acyl-CoA dehydrogenase family protein [Bradyrhizobium sp. WSM 1738]|uniref:acyl-CoA dehydrogenase family protein n=1 Tax=Bradyrhizobium hereditatis TaxID=2821405 RepID=UPI001CE2CE20|nr:acyl-CoA dehydrogenase family protein [Bradyrhizobium hereditatis]MCA6119670.1 acyl-CoA dehydrogenase family protein [Bradyrhizobium hereditatis]